MNQFFNLHISSHSHLANGAKESSQHIIVLVTNNTICILDVTPLATLQKIKNKKLFPICELGYHLVLGP